MMDKKQMGWASLLLLLALSLAATGCSGGARVGKLQTRSQVVERDGAAPVTVEIAMGAGKLDIAGGARELLEATFTYNVAELEPAASYANGRLAVRDQGVRTSVGSLLDIRDFRNEWELHFSEEAPLAMDLELGAGRANLELGELALTRLDIDGGAGEVVVDLSGSQTLRQLSYNAGAGASTIDLSGDWAGDLDADINGGLGAITVRLPAGVGVRVGVDTGIGAVEASGLQRDGDIYTNEAYGTADVTLRIHISSGVGPVRLELEEQESY
jgi:hypothetical protein